MMGHVIKHKTVFAKNKKRREYNHTISAIRHRETQRQTFMLGSHHNKTRFTVSRTAAVFLEIFEFSDP